MSCCLTAVLQLSCVLWWSEADRLLLLAHESHKEDTGRLFCYVSHQHLASYFMLFSHFQRDNITTILDYNSFDWRRIELERNQRKTNKPMTLEQTSHFKYFEISKIALLLRSTQSIRLLYLNLES